MLVILKYVQSSSILCLPATSGLNRISLMLDWHVVRLRSWVYEHVDKQINSLILPDSLAKGHLGIGAAR